MALYHSARGSASYTINGNPTIIDGVVTGLSGQDYIKFQALPSSFQELEINLRYVLNQKPTNWQLLLGPITPTTPRIVFINNRYRLDFSSSGTLKYMQQWGIPPEIDVVCNYNVKITADKIAVKYTNLNNGTIKTDSFEGVVDVNTFFEQAFAFGASSSFESLDLNHTYIKIDGQPWFGICPIEVKKHQIMGPVGYTVVGSPTITEEGVASNFSLTSYCLVNSRFAPSNSSWEEQICFKLDYLGERKNMALINSTLSDYLFPKISVVTDNSTSLTVQSCLSGNGTSWSIGQRGYVVSYDYSKKSWVKLTYSDGTYTIKLKQEGEDFRVVATYENKPVIYQSPNATSFSIGADIGAGGNWKSFFIGSIYLNETYIKVNEKLWFWQPQATKYIQRNNQLVWADPKLYLSAPDTVELTTVGSPTITNGVVSGFSGSNYVQSSSTFPGSTATSLEFSTKFNISSFASTSTIASSTTSIIPFHLAVRDSKFRLYPGRENIYKIGNFVLSANTNYWIKLFWDSTTGWKLQYSTDGINYTTDFENYNPSNSAPKDNYIVIGRNYPNGGQEGLLGTLDLNHTYIKVNDVMWFQYPKPATYTVVGSPTIVDGIASGISNSDYVTVPYFLPFSKNSFEYVIKFKIGISNSGTNGTIFSFPYRKDGSQGASYGIYKYSNALTAYCGYNANGDNITLSIPFTANSDMWVKWSFANGILKLTYSTDGINWNVGVNNEGGTEILDGTAQDISLGRISSWPGFSVDLNHTYIKVNDQLWFYGKNYATQNIAPVPAGYTYNTTTTTSIGYVDMRTQQFTPAPEGATIGRDE